MFQLTSNIRQIIFAYANNFTCVLLLVHNMTHIVVYMCCVYLLLSLTYYIYIYVQDEESKKKVRMLVDLLGSWKPVSG